MKIVWIISGMLWVIDRLSKLWAENVLSLEQVRAVWPGVFRFAYARNTGMALSMLTGNNALLLALNIALIALVLLIYFRAKGLPRLTRAGLALIVLGGLGNIVDRAVYGYVIDFIELLFVRFAVFNVADIMVTGGAVLAIAGLLVPDKGEAT